MSYIDAAALSPGVAGDAEDAEAAEAVLRPGCPLPLVLHPNCAERLWPEGVG